MPTDYLEERIDAMLRRLHEVYDGIGHSSGRPYLYFVYPPEQEQAIRRLVREKMLDDGSLHYLHVDFLRLSLESLAGQEEKRAEILNHPVMGSGSAQSIVRQWAKRLHKDVSERLQAKQTDDRPVIVLQGLAALHPLGNPTSLMEYVAEKEVRDLHTNKIVPVILFVPGFRMPQTSREYKFLSPESETLSFYRGEEI